MKVVTLLLISVSAMLTDDKICRDSLEGRPWGSIRIGVHYPHITANRASNPGLTNRVVDEMIPKVISFWESTLEVQREPKRLVMHRTKIHLAGVPQYVKSTCTTWGDVHVTIPNHLLSGHISGNPGQDVDMVLLITIDDIPACKDDTLAFAYSCRWDDCGRPVVASVNICPRGIDIASKSSIAKFYGTIHHELTHAFGFSSGLFPWFRHPDGTSRVSEEPIYYTCSIKSGVPKVQWNVSDFKRGALPFWFMTNVISEIKERSVGSKCKCPTDPAKTYKAEDIEHCLTNKHECIFAVKTPNVVAKAKEFYGCNTVQGAELENQPASISCSIYESHWKGSMFGTEYMNQYQSDGLPFISPITLALLEDSGWYRVKYNMATPLIPGTVLGYKSGCNFVHDKCFDNGKPVKMDHSGNFFCTETLERSCSPDALAYSYCLASKSALKVPATYRYGLNSQMKSRDFCPVFLSESMEKWCINSKSAIGIEMNGENSRCLEVDSSIGGRLSYCLDIHCYGDGEYSIIYKKSGIPTETSSRCTSNGQRIKEDYYTFNCADPKVVCAAPAMPHIPIPIIKRPNAVPATNRFEQSESSKTVGEPFSNTTVVIVVVCLCVILVSVVVFLGYRHLRRLQTSTGNNISAP
jgi:hypothetical protein